MFSILLSFLHIHSRFMFGVIIYLYINKKQLFMSANRVFVMGDVHGAYKALRECLSQVSFNYSKDTLICLGDVCDRGTEVYECFEELLQIKNLIYMLGNHDDFTLDWFLHKNRPEIWLMQGGAETIESYRKRKIPGTHIGLLEKARLYYILDDFCFVHGGFSPGIPLNKQDKDTFIWDRSLTDSVMDSDYGQSQRINPYEKVFVGHTPTIKYGSSEPIIKAGLVLMDTGAGWPLGKLSIMDVQTGEFWQSRSIHELYSNKI